MSPIDDLIAELCPSGVELRALGEVGQFVRGNGLQKRDFVDEGVGCIHYGQIYTVYGTSTTVTKSFVTAELAARLRAASPGDLIVTTTSENIEDVGKAVAWLGDSDIAVGGHSCVYSHALDPLYAAYCFQTSAFHRQKKRFAKGTKVKEVSTRDLGRIDIPVPPLSIQREVAAVLGKMEALEGALAGGLKAELEARRQQYAYHRDACFAFPEAAGVPWLPMGEVGEFRRGKRITKNDFVESGVGAIHYGEIYTHYGTFASETRTFVTPELAARLRTARRGDLVIAATGENVEDVCKAVAWLGDDEVVIHDDCYLFRHSLHPKYVAYFFQSTAFHVQKTRYAAGAKMVRVSGDNLRRIRIPVPPPDEQQRIVETLDKLDALVRDLSIELPAELRSRRRQYEHYRDRLLTFEPVAA